MFPKPKVESPQVLEPEKAQLPAETRRGTQAPFVSSMAKSEPGTCSLETGDGTGARPVERGGGPWGSGEKSGSHSRDRHPRPAETWARGCREFEMTLTALGLRGKDARKVPWRIYSTRQSPTFASCK